MTNFPQLGTFGLPIETLVKFAFYFIVAAYVIFTAILYYHWNNYGTDKKITNLTMILYLVSTLPLILVMGIMLFII